MPHRFLLIETVSVAYVIIDAIISAVAAEFAERGALMDDGRMRLVCISGALFGSLLSILIFPPNGGTARAFLIKLLASSIAGVVFTPLIFHWLPLPRNTDGVLVTSATVALLAVGVIKYTVPKLEHAVGSRILTEAGYIAIPPLTILYVEHEAEAGDMVVRLLGTMPARVDVVHTLAEGRSAVRAIDYDVVLLDLRLTDSDTQQTQSEIQSLKRAARAPVVVVSGRFEPDIKQRCMESGADIFIHKLDAFADGGTGLVHAIRRALLHYPRGKNGFITRQIDAANEP